MDLVRAFFNIKLRGIQNVVTMQDQEVVFETYMFPLLLCLIKHVLLCPANIYSNARIQLHHLTSLDSSISITTLPIHHLHILLPTFCRRHLHTHLRPTRRPLIDDTAHILRERLLKILAKLATQPVNCIIHPLAIIPSATIPIAASSLEVPQFDVHVIALVVKIWEVDLFTHSQSV